MKINVKSLGYIITDAISFGLALFLAALIRFDMSVMEAIENLTQGTSAAYYIVLVLSVVGLSFLFGTYKTLYVNMTFRDVIRQFDISLVTVIIVLLCGELFGYNMSKGITIIFGVLFFIFTIAARCVSAVYKLFAQVQNRSDKENVRAVIVGAGNAGGMLIHMLSLRRDMKIIPVAVVDDDVSKQKMTFSGVRVRGAVADVARIAKECRADVIIIAIPSASSGQLKTIFEKCKSAALPIKTFGNLVDFNDFISGSHKSLKNLSIEDLLFRDSIKTDMTDVSNYISGKSVLVTGGAGSIGSEICRQVLECGCRHLVIMDINENGLFFLQNDLLEKYPAERFCVRVGSVRDKVRMGYLFKSHKFDIVFHAAAHKHVPLMEENVFEAVKNNVFGTKNTIECCIENGTERFVLISTDKAVNPTNIMGATKRVAELLVQHYNGRGCELSAVRFGNVLGSNGSVIPIFQRQIESGGPVTVTHRDIMRYFMTIPEAVSLVLNAGVKAEGGEVFVLDMGEPVSIYDLACNMIELAGLKLGQDINIEITGLRPGEKMFEELKLDSESYTRTAQDKIFVMHANKPTARIEEDIAALEELLSGDNSEKSLRDAIFETISMDYASCAERGGKIESFSGLTQES